MGLLSTIHKKLEMMNGGKFILLLSFSVGCYFVSIQQSIQRSIEAVDQGKSNSRMLDSLRWELREYHSTEQNRFDKLSTKDSDISTIVEKHEQIINKLAEGQQSIRTRLWIIEHWTPPSVGVKTQ